MKIRVNKSIAKGIVNVPSSKSYTHRFLICSALSNHTCIIKNIDLSNDINATLSCLKTLGKYYSYENKTIKIETIEDYSLLDEELVFDCNESGSTLRFMIPIALLLNKKLVFKGTSKLISRGIEGYLDIFNKCGIKYKILKDKIIINGKLRPGEYHLSSLNSSQYISGLLFALPLLEEDSKIVIDDKLVSENYIDITLDVLSKFGIKIIRNNNEFFIKGNQKYIPNNFEVEGDYSSAAFLDVLNYLDGNVTINNLNENSIQGDKVFYDLFKFLKEGYQIINIENCIDLGPILFVFASIFNGGRFINTSRLKVKESDRVKSICDELVKFGVSLTCLDNELIINKSNLHKPSEELDSHNDHRVAMALIILLTKFGGIIDNVESIDKSYSNFLLDLKNLGIEINEI